jgi:hypothetical protein
MIFITIILYAIAIELGMDLDALFAGLSTAGQVLVFMAGCLMLWGDLRRI